MKRSETKTVQKGTKNRGTIDAFNTIGIDSSSVGISTTSDDVTLHQGVGNIIAETKNSRPTSLVAACGAEWESQMGAVDYARLGAALKSVRRLHDETDFERWAQAIGVYCQEAIAQGAARFATPERFAKFAKVYLDFTRPRSREELATLLTTPVVDMPV